MITLQLNSERVGRKANGMPQTRRSRFYFAKLKLKLEKERKQINIKKKNDFFFFFFFFFFYCPLWRQNLPVRGDHYKAPIRYIDLKRYHQTISPVAPPKHLLSRHRDKKTSAITANSSNNIKNKTKQIYIYIIVYIYIFVRLGADVVSSSPAARQFFFIYIYIYIYIAWMKKYYFVYSEGKWNHKSFNSFFVNGFNLKADQTLLGMLH